MLGRVAAQAYSAIPTANLSFTRGAVHRGHEYTWKQPTDRRRVLSPGARRWLRRVGRAVRCRTGASARLRFVEHGYVWIVNSVRGLCSFPVSRTVKCHSLHERAVKRPRTPSEMTTRIPSPTPSAATRRWQAAWVTRPMHSTGRLSGVRHVPAARVRSYGALRT
jgi:hypothetical protein